MNERVGESYTRDESAFALGQLEAGVYSDDPNVLKGWDVSRVIQHVESYVVTVIDHKKRYRTVPSRTKAAEFKGTPVTEAWHRIQEVAAHPEKNPTLEYYRALLHFLDAIGFPAKKIRDACNASFYSTDVRAKINRAAEDNESLQMQGWEPIPEVRRV